MKVIGYYNSFAENLDLARLNLDPLTHINYAFLLPKESGEVYFKDESLVKSVVDYCHKLGKKVFVSVGGWCDEEVILQKVFEKICVDKDTLKKFVKAIMKIVKEYNFDGVDIDWEYPTKDFAKAYEKLLKKLHKKLNKENKQLTIAIYHAVEGDFHFDRVEAVSNEVLEYVDWLNVMTYDCHIEKNHSSFKLAKRCVDYWVYQRKIEKQKILIGVPFYLKPSQMPYYELVTKVPEKAYSNFWQDESYNGVYLARSKFLYAKANCGGVFIWAINYDADGEYSLLKTMM